MSDLLKELIRDELRTLGVSAKRLSIGFSEQRLILGGELDSFHQVQLAQVAAKRIAPDFQVVLNLSVFDPKEVVPNVKTEERELHQLRNRLNEIGLGLQLVAEELRAGQVSDANQTVARLISRMPSSGNQRLEAKPWIQRQRILIVEDNYNESQLLCGFLRQQGALVAQAHESAAAYRLIDEGFIPNVLLLDMHLPVSNGKQIAEQIRSRDDCAGIGIIAISGTHPDRLGLGVKAGELDAWLPKPLNLDRLLETLQLMMRKRRDAGGIEKTDQA